MNNIIITGIVISSMPIGEYDRRLEILSDDLGRISVFARGARKPSSSLVACSRTFAFGKFELYQGKSSYSLSSAEIRTYFPKLSEDFELNCYGSYFLELARYFSQEGLEANGIIELLYYSLKALESKKFSLSLVRAVYELKMIDLNGIYREPERDSMSVSCAYTVDYVISHPASSLYTFKLVPDVEKEFAELTSSMITKISDRKFKSLAMLEMF